MHSKWVSSNFTFLECVNCWNYGDTSYKMMTLKERESLHPWISVHDAFYGVRKFA